MSKKKNTQMVLIARDGDEETLNKIAIIREAMRFMAQQAGHRFEERCLTLDEYKEELKNQEEEVSQKEEEKETTEK